MPKIATPQELPAAPRVFVNRTEEQDHLSSLAVPEDTGTPFLALITGIGGVGKTALAIRAATAAKDTYPDGAVYVDLAEQRRRGVTDLGDVLLGFLRSFGVPAEEIPTGEAARAARFRTETAGKAILVFLDNVTARAEIDVLMPSSPRSAVVVTSHLRPEELDPLADVRISLSGLADAHGLEVLGRYCGRDRLEAEPEAAVALVHAASGVPLALHLIGRRLAVRSVPLARILAEVHAKGRDAMLEDIAEIAYTGLEEDTRRAYRLLAAHPGPGFDADDLAALTGDSTDRAEAWLDELRGSHLVHTEPGGRFGMGELIRAHARGLSEGEDLTAAGNRLTGDLLLRASHADRATGSRLRLALDPGGRNPFTSRAEALTWLERRRALLVTVQRQAHRQGHLPQVWALTEAMWPLFMDRRNELDWYESSDLGVRAARDLGDERVLARMLTFFSRWHMEHGDPGDALTLLDEAITLAEGHDRVLASAWEFRGRALARQGSYGEAVTAHLTAYGLDTDPRARGLQRQFTGQAYLALGDPAEAMTHLREARELFITHPRDLGKVLVDLGRAVDGLGRRDEARELFASAAVVLEAEGAAYYQAEALGELGTRFGDREALERARAIYAGMGSSRAAALAERLSEV